MEVKVRIVLRDWSKARKANPVVAEKTKRILFPTYISKERKRYDNKGKDHSGNQGL